MMLFTLREILELNEFLLWFKFYSKALKSSESTRAFYIVLSAYFQFFFSISCQFCFRILFILKTLIYHTEYKLQARESLVNIRKASPKWFINRTWATTTNFIDKSFPIDKTALICKQDIAICQSMCDTRNSSKQLRMRVNRVYQSDFCLSMMFCFVCYQKIYNHNKILNGRKHEAANNFWLNLSVFH